MGKFNRHDKFGGDRNSRHFGKKSFGGGFGDRQMYDATCSQCGKPCQVPFRPTGDRDVFCSDCFRDKKQAGFAKSGPANFGKPAFEKRSDNNTDHAYLKQQLTALNNKLDKLLDLMSVSTAPASMSKVTAQDVEMKPVVAKTKTVSKKPKSKKKK